MVYIHRFNCFYTQKGWRILSGIWVNELGCHCPGGCGGNILHISAYKGCHILHYGYLRSCTTNITEDARPLIIDAPLTCIFRMSLGTWVCSFCSLRQSIHQKWIVMYQCQYFTIISSISQCDNKCETQNAEPEIGTDGSSLTWWHPWVDRYGSGVGLPRAGRSRFWTGLEPNCPVFVVQIRTAGGLPGPVANTCLLLSVFLLGNPLNLLLTRWCTFHFQILVYPFGPDFWSILADKYLLE